MTYLVHTSHPQLVGLWLASVGWSLTAVTLGLIQWRVWHVADVSVITSGVAWVGIWRACFYSHSMVTSEFRVMYCQSIGLREGFTPPEIAAAQVLMLLALAAGLCGKAGAAYALRNVYFGLEKRAPIRHAFLAAGVLCVSSAVCSLVPLLWNLNSVVTNQTIDFPEDFHMPPAPRAQYAGAGIGVGLVACLLLVVSGILFLSYRFPVVGSGAKVAPSCLDTRDFERTRAGTSLSCGSTAESTESLSDSRARDNPVFQSDDNV